MALNLGGIIRLTYSVKDANAALTNPATAILTITQPDGTIAPSTTITLPPSVTGQLSYDFVPTQAGLHSVHWATTGPTTAEDDVFVAEAPGRLFVSVDEAVGQLRASGVITSDADREQLQWLCLVACGAVEADLDRTIARRTVTETYDGGDYVLILKSTPVISVTSVVVSGVALTVNDWILNPSGFLYRGSTSSYWTFTGGRQNVVVTYVAGYTNPPYVARKVALDTVQAMWQSSQTAFHPALDESAEQAVSTAVAGLADPLRRAYESLRMAGVA